MTAITTQTARPCCVEAHGRPIAAVARQAFKSDWRQTRL